MALSPMCFGDKAEHLALSKFTVILVSVPYVP